MLWVGPQVGLKVKASRLPLVSVAALEHVIAGTNAICCQAIA